MTLREISHMKKILFNACFLLAASGLYQANAQCTIDQFYTGSNTLQSPIGSNTSLPDGQSFKAGQSGGLHSVSLDISATNPGCTLTTMDVRVDILDGNGISGTQLASQVFTLPVEITRTMYTFNFSTPALVTANQMYTITFTLVPGQNCGSGEPQLIWYFNFPTNYWSATGGTQYQDGVVTSLGNTQYFNTCVGPVCNETTGNVTQTSCFSYTVPSGDETYTTSGTYKDTLTNSAGCDSVITINLTINNVDVTVSNNAPALTANAGGAAYQWVDCDNNFAVLSGESAQNFTASSNGNYAVVITQNGCVDTSACESITNVGISENIFGNDLFVYPNPTAGNITIQTGSNIEDLNIIVRNTLGEVICSGNYPVLNKIDFNIASGAGIYFIELNCDKGHTVKKVIKQ